MHRPCLPGSRPVLTALFILCTLIASFGQTLYDASSNTLPGSQGWTYFALGSATQSLSNNAAVLDTSTSTSTQAGYSRTDTAPLDHTNGFTLLFTAQVLAEGHTSVNRAGFSVILLSDDKRGIELGFWTNLIFAQSDSPLFTHAEDVAFPTSDNFVDFALTFLATNYVLRANGTNILSGPIRDYTAFNGPINPYRTPDFLFLGDDTTSASATVALRRVTLVKAPILELSDPNIVCWTGVSNQTYALETSSNLLSWFRIASVTSTSNRYCYTNPAAQSQQFYRVSFPLNP